MGRHTGPVCRLCRREGTKLFLKGARCETAKCAIARREYPPGMRARRQRKRSEYGMQLREKQKVKRYYGVYERQFRRYFKLAERMRGNTGEELLVALERRLDNILLRMGFAHSHAEARQLATHGHIVVNGHRMDRPSYAVRVDDRIAVKNRPKSLEMVRGNVESVGRIDTPFLEVGGDPPEGRMTRLPTREDISLPVSEQLIVELCSK